jgi:uncharacterized protein YjbI with pentapeptide repeats
VFSENLCSADGCSNKALSLREHCFIHLEDKQAFTKEIETLLEKEQVLKSLELSGITLENLKLRDKEIWYCNFSHSRFNEVEISDSRLRLTYFDFSLFENCSWTKIDARFTVFAGSQFSNSRFLDSELPRCSFLGIKCINCVFEGLDLYDSRFTSSTVENTNFMDCNLKRVYFNQSKLHRVTFKSSNVEESFFEKVERYD